MSYRVVLQRQALQDLDESYSRAAENAPDAARKWLDRFHAALTTLEELPERCGFAPENALVDVAVRQLLFGRKSRVFRVLYAIDGDTVRILTIRRAQRRFLTAEQLREVLHVDDDPTVRL
jgi:plasmid stabilization system protein ParE